MHWLFIICSDNVIKKLTIVHSSFGQDMATTFNLGNDYSKVQHIDIMEVDSLTQNIYSSLRHKCTNSTSYFVVNWMLGNTCNYTCRYCPDYLHNGSAPWTAYNTAVTFTKRLFGLINNKNIHFEFTGGEVTMWKNFSMFASFLKENGCTIGVVSNGSRTLRWWSENMSCIDSVSLSYHPETSVTMHFLELINLLKDNIKVHINIMADPLYLTKVKMFAEQILSIQGITAVVQPLVKDFVSHTYHYRLDQHALINLLNKKLREKKIPEGFLSRGFMVKEGENFNLTTDASELILQNENRWKGWSCFAGIEQIIIDNCGNIFRGWCKEGGMIGNISDSFFQLPVNPVKCNKDFCHCSFDITSTKHL